MKQSKLAEYLELTDEELEDMGLDEDDIYPDEGNSGEMIYSYYFNVPENTPDHILAKKNWSLGQRVEIDLSYFDDQEQPPEE